MCYDLEDYDPFEVHYEMHSDGSLTVDSEPMEDYNWEEWLEFGDIECPNA